MQQLSAIAGALRYEFWMQLRRSSVWILLALLSTLLFALWYLFESGDLHGYYNKEQRIYIPPSQHDPVLFWAQVLGMLLPLGVGLLLADRLARDRSTHVDEILDTLPSSLGTRLLGKYLGSTLATLIPILLIYASVIVYIVTQVPGSQAFMLAAQAFGAVLLPGILFAAGVSIAIPSVLKVPVYQFLFIGYWFWANLMTPKIGLPSPVATMLNAAGPWAQEGFFHFQWTFLRLHPTVAQASESVALITGLGFAAVIAAWGYLRWQHSTR